MPTLPSRQAIERAGDCAEDLAAARPAPPALREAARLIESLVQLRQARCATPSHSALLQASNLEPELHEESLEPAHSTVAGLHVAGQSPLEACVASCV